MGRVYIAHNWRLPKVIFALLVIELPLTIAALTLFGHADPDLYRTKLWQNGFDQGFNSAPNEILYAYANHQPISVPLVWSQFMTQFNVVVSVLSMFILLVKSMMYVMHAFLPIIALFVSAVEIVLYSIAVRNQSAPDLSDKHHPSPGLPWYLSKGCRYAEPGNWTFCMQARASFAVTITLLALFTAYFIMAIWSCFPTDAEKQERDAEREADIELKKLDDASPDSEMTREEKWERNREMFMTLPKTPNTPGFGPRPLMTPRTTAFTALNGGGSPVTPNLSGPSRALPFRQPQRGDAMAPDGR